ncbi:WD40 repeat-like protein [Rhizoclosmatium globosum]|uniref:WD40 repeat-like protein n=1 Tax=Rhizoclosmatium globosum TaxID=329046 RepID=A0A1Y2B2V4_9FUNG|nr:WD40 repeat-like protein [Rhizoclosmatium globosum]|eukprot:ORY28890.1 WD40 repeat-like protein [Rhizoclosmatium globosum]
MEEDQARVKDKKQSLLKTPVDAFKVLVVDGLKKLSVPEWKTKTLLIVIDALDELNKDTRHSVLKILTTLCPELPGFVKIVTTGRPERDIYYALQGLSPFVLSPSDNNNAADLKVFVKYRLQALWGAIQQGTDAEKCCEALVEKADGLFIYARNVCEYIKKQNLEPKQSLVDILALTSGSDSIYRAIIERELQTNRAERLAHFKCVFSVLFTAQRPLTLGSLANIGGLDIHEVESVVSEFRSILKIEHGGIVSAIHKSVKDFFTDFTRCGGELFIQAVDARIAVCCLQILIGNLSHNMAHLDPTKFYSKDELAQLTVLNEDLLYAVLFWASHFKLGFSKASVVDQQAIIKLLYKFCTKTLPYYLEALLLVSKLNDVFPMVHSVSDILSGFTHIEEVKTVLSLLNDLKFVAVNFRTQLLASPLQVYNHALIAVPLETKYYCLFQGLAPARITIGAEKEWSPFTLLGHSNNVRSVAFSPDSHTVVSGSSDNTVKLWSVETGECVKTLLGHSGWVNSVAFSPDSKTVVAGSADKTVKLWSVETGECVKTFVGHSSSVVSATFSPDSKFVVSGSVDKTVKLWSVETGECVKTLVGHSGWVFSVAFSPNSKTVVSGSADKTVKLWSVETGECVKTFVGNASRVISVAFSPDSKFVVSGSDDKTVKLWSVETGELSKTLVGHSGWVFSVAFSPNSKTVVSGSADKTVKLWCVETGECVKTFVGNASRVNSVAFSPDSKFVVSGSDDKTVKLWSVDIRGLSKALKGHSEGVRSVAFSPDSIFVVSGSSDNTVKLWSVETGECVKTLVGHSGWVNSVAFSPDSKTVVSGSADKTIKLWSVETGELFKTLVGHSNSVTSVSFSPDSNTVVSGSDDKTVKLWSVETGECSKTLVGHTLFVNSVAFSPDSIFVVSGSRDNTVKLWFVETGELSKTLKGHSEGVKSVTFLPDSKTVVSGSVDMTVKLWSVETGECLETRDWDGSDLRDTFFPSELTVQDGWICLDKILLYFIGRSINEFSESSVSWHMANNVFCLALRN